MLLGGMTYDPDMIKKGCHFGIKNDRCAALLYNVEQNGFEWEPVPGPDRKGTINSKPVPRLVPRDGWVPAS